MPSRRPSIEIRNAQYLKEVQHLFENPANTSCNRNFDTAAIPTGENQRDVHQLNRLLASLRITTESARRPRVHCRLLDKADGGKKIVVNVYLHGTCSNSLDGKPDPDGLYPKGELISVLQRNTEAFPGEPEISEDGPGSDDLDYTNRWVFPAADSYFSGLRRFANWLFPGSGFYSQVTQTVFGWGVEELVDDVVAKLLGIKTWADTNRETLGLGASPEIDVNVVGWSRGGAATFRLANEMYQNASLRDIPINLCAVDPVPGLGRSDRENRQLPSNVKTAVCFYAKNELSFGFSPELPTVSDATRLVPIVFPGSHATLVGNQTWRYLAREETDPLGAKLTQSGDLVRHFTEEFLTARGTKLKDKLSLDTSGILTQFQQIHTDELNGFYKKLATETYTFKQISAALWGVARKIIVGLKSFFNIPMNDVPALQRDAQETGGFVNAVHRFFSANQNMPTFMSFVDTAAPTQSYTRMSAVCSPGNQPSVSEEETSALLNETETPLGQQLNSGEEPPAENKRILKK